MGQRRGREGWMSPGPGAEKRMRTGETEDESSYDGDGVESRE
jgi:hypothetical protein